ncbi:MAG: tRNA (adenosine(37)-N6)-threonylcarbamoyltransferase complex ATPase subunit type 1 TsaE [Pirellulales bacterium]|nr:tRNA (adenosine(37)-N6)-threonylcarbamoyltransferase complex ATPase subunit type 1 TsaE [Pirellulales bacterium]
MHEIGSVDLLAIRRLAESMLRRIPEGSVIGLVGTLGAGKTTLVQAIAAAAGIDVSDVTSPTFTLLQTHRGKILIHHLDAYRLADEDEFLELGVDELFEDARAWTIVEWADRVEAVMPRNTLWMRIDLNPDSESRRITLDCQAANMAEVMEQIADDLS